MEVENEITRSKRTNPPRKCFGIEYRHFPTMEFKKIPGERFWRCMDVEKWSAWRIISWYVTERDRNNALNHYRNKTPMIFPSGEKFQHLEEWRTTER